MATVLANPPGPVLAGTELRLPPAPIPAHEAERLQNLRDYQILDTAAEAEFDDLVLLASQICGTPIALVSLVDGRRQWFKAKVGINATETSRDVAFCAHAILDDEVMVVPDATRDARFSENPLVTGEPRVRFYAGAPLVTPEGYALGTLCVVDQVARQITPGQSAALRALARQAVSLLNLRRSRHRYQGLVNSIDGIVWEADAETLRFTFVSPQAERILGYPPADWLGAGFWVDHLHPDDRGSAPSCCARAASNPRGRGVEYRMIAADGRTVWVRHLVTAVNEGGRGYTKLRGLMLDVTAERHARAEQARLASIVDTSSDAIVCIDRDGVILTWNEGAARTFGWSAAEAVGQSIALMIPPDQGHELAEIRESTRRGDRFAQLEMDRRRRDGSTFPASLSVSPLKDAAGNVVGAAAIIRDISEQRRAAQELAIQNAVLQAQNDAAIDGILVVAPDGKIVTFNRRFVEMWQIPDDVAASRSDAATLEAVVDLLVDPEGFCDRVAYLYSHPTEKSRDTISLKDGRVIDRHTAPITGAGGEYCGRVWYFRDVTDDRRAETLERERNALREALTAMERVFGIVGHELRTPLAAVRAMSEFLMLDGARDTESFEQFLTRINDEVVRMGQTVNDLLEAARLDSGLAKWNWAPFEVYVACGEALEAVGPLVDPAAVELACDVEDGLTMLGDAGAVRRLVVNLLSNAAKHTTRGCVRVTARRRLEADGAWIDLAVSDSGSGIPAEILPKLGEAFALNAGMTGDCHVRGTGLGLSICKGIAAAHGGRLTFRSEEGRGTTVTASLRADLESPAGQRPKLALTA